MKIVAVIPCYRVTAHIGRVLAGMPPSVESIICVDDGCPDGSGRFIQKSCIDPRVAVLFHEQNQGVGGAVVTGYRAALADGADIIVKIDGDGQMDPDSIPNLVNLIVLGDADYCKGNRFYSPENLAGMPARRLFGNAVLSLFAKFSTGYWKIVDPTNGYTAIHVAALKALPLQKIDKGYFFETDMLFRLNICRAVVRDVPMSAQYGGEESHLKISRVVAPFLYKHCRNLARRVAYNYYVRDFSLASIELPLGLGLMLFGVIFGLNRWFDSVGGADIASAGTVMLSALPVLVGFQMFLAGLNFDIQNDPVIPLQKFVRKSKNLGAAGAGPESDE
jgi:glycosyltransferase involved in cell wall biosynthesis